MIKQTYRQKLRTCVPPVIPFMAIFLTDLTFIEENEDRVPRKTPKPSPSSEKTGDGEQATSSAEGGEQTNSPQRNEQGEESNDASKEAATVQCINISSEENTSTEPSIGIDTSSDSKDSENVEVKEEPEMLVNFLKMELLGKVLLNLKKFQKTIYKNLIPSAPFQKYFAEGVQVSRDAYKSQKKGPLRGKMLFWSQEDIYQSSLEIEHRVLDPLWFSAVTFLLQSDLVVLLFV